MPMGSKISADVFLRELSMLFQNIPYILVYIDDILIITKGSYEQHLQAVHKALIKLREARTQLNIDKYFFAKDRVDYLGYVISRSDITPHTSKVQLIMDMPRPKTVTQVKRFTGIINLYRDLWKHRAHHLAPIMNLT